MKRLTIFLPILLLGCSTLDTARTAATVADASGVPVPRPCSKTIGDEKAVALLATGVDVAALTISALARANVPGFIKGTPSALRIGAALDDARNGVNAAALARQACDAASYTKALGKATAAYNLIKSSIPGA